MNNVRPDYNMARAAWIDYSTSVLSSVGEIDRPKISDQINRGLRIIYPEKRVAFVTGVFNIVKARGYESNIDIALDIMEALASGSSFEDADKLIPTILSPDAIEYVRRFVLIWANQGPEYYRRRAPMGYDSFTPDEQRSLKILITNNSAYAEAQNGRLETDSSIFEYTEPSTVDHTNKM